MKKKQEWVKLVWKLILDWKLDLKLGWKMYRHKKVKPHRTPSRFDCSWRCRAVWIVLTTLRNVGFASCILPLAEDVPQHANLVRVEKEKILHKLRPVIVLLWRFNHPMMSYDFLMPSFYGVNYNYKWGENIVFLVLEANDSKISSIATQIFVLQI